MKYLSSDVELCKLASVMHLLPPGRLPSLIIVDDFSGFFPSAPGEGGAARGGVAPDARTTSTTATGDFARCVAAPSPRYTSAPPPFVDDRTSTRSAPNRTIRAETGTRIAGIRGERDDVARVDDDDRFAVEDDDGCLLLVAETVEPGRTRRPWRTSTNKGSIARWRSERLVNARRNSRSRGGNSLRLRARGACRGERRGATRRRRSGSPSITGAEWSFP